MHVALESPTVARVVLEASHPAAHVRVESPRRGTWSDNGFFMYPHRRVNLTFTSEASIVDDTTSVDDDDFASSLTVTSLADVLAKLSPF